MQQISIHIPDTQVSFMMELLQKFDFVKIDLPIKEIKISDNQKALVEIERKNTKENTKYMLDWDTVKDNFNVD